MKIRQGFVSNSSSSSFIIALAKVVDKPKLEKFLSSLENTDHYLFKYNVEVRQLKDIRYEGKYNSKVGRASCRERV